MQESDIGTQSAQASQLDELIDKKEAQKLMTDDLSLRTQLDTEIQRLKELKNKGFKILIDLYQFKIYWMIRKVVLSHESANDVLQNTYIKIYRNIDKFRQESKLSTWIYRIAYNESIRFLSNESKIKKISIDTVQENYTKKLYADNYFDANKLSVKFHQLLSELTVRQRTIFNMKYFDELKFKEISKIIEMNENTIKSIYYDVEKKIKRDINE